MWYAELLRLLLASAGVIASGDLRLRLGASSDAFGLWFFLLAAGFGLAFALQAVGLPELAGASVFGSLSKLCCVNLGSRSPLGAFPRLNFEVLLSVPFTFGVLAVSGDLLTASGVLPRCLLRGLSAVAGATAVSEALSFPVRLLRASVFGSARVCLAALVARLFAGRPLVCGAGVSSAVVSFFFLPRVFGGVGGTEADSSTNFCNWPGAVSA